MATQQIDLSKCESYPEQRATFERLCADLPRGMVGVAWLDGWLTLRAADGREERFRGASVEGCDASDDFVQHLAKRLA